MFAAVAVNILKCLFTYLGLLFAFSLTLHFLFRSQKEFDSVGFTFLKVRVSSYSSEFFIARDHRVVGIKYFPDWIQPE